MTGTAAAPDAAAVRAAVRRAVTEATARLAAAGVPSPDHDARVLAAHALGSDRLDLVLLREVPADFEPVYGALLERRAAREPLQHIVGWAPFRGLVLHARAGVFVPRPETEVVAQQAVDEAARVARGGGRPVVVDLCCGSGALGIAVASEVPAASVVATDLSADAVALTRTNARDCGVTLRVEQGDVADPGVLADLDGAVDVVVSNPPYIPPDCVPVDPEVRDHDPALALFGGGPDGLATPRAVVAAAARLLCDGGLLVMEHADVQGAAARDAVAATGAFTGIATLPDLTGRDRMVLARRVARTAPGAT